MCACARARAPAGERPSDRVHALTCSAVRSRSSYKSSGGSRAEVNNTLVYVRVYVYTRAHIYTFKSKIKVQLKYEHLLIFDEKQYARAVVD